MPPVDLPIHAPRRRRRWLWIGLAGAGAIVVLLVLIAAAAVPLSSDTLRKRLVANLSRQLESEVELGDLRLRVFPTLHAEGSGLVIRHKDHRDEPPLISIKSFTADAGLLGLLRSHVGRVELVGLDIQISPNHDDGPDSPDNDADNAENGYRDVVVDTLVANGARLVIIPKKAGKKPKVWSIHALTMHAVGGQSAMPFDATLTNGVPPGEIETSGHFGPWASDDPGATPLDGTFIFNNADLSVFKGISGILSSHGTFSGSLGRIDINGETDTPQFTVKVSGHPVPLHAKYHSIVDGTNGDTLLERIDASFLKTSLVAKGAVIDAPEDVHGRDVSLDVTIDQGRLEDVLRLAVKKPSLMTGDLKLTTKLLLPSRDADVVDRLQLDGQFAIATVSFTQYEVQKRINELSHRGRGKAPDVQQEGVVSNFQGRFTLADGVLALPSLEFAVPGAVVQMAGKLALRAETLDFRGTVLLDAKISETMTGFKSLLLKVVDPLFGKKGGGSAIPLKVGGTFEKPAVGLDMGRVFKRDKSF